MLDCAYRLVSFNNPDRLEVRNAVDKRLVAVKGEGNPPRHLHFDTVSGEADAVASLIAEKVEAGEYTRKDFAILVRSNNDADPFLRALNMRGIQHRFSGSRGLYSREEIKLLISFLRAVSKFDDSVSLYYLAGSEIYDVAQADLVRLNNFARRRNLSLHDVLELLADGVGLRVDGSSTGGSAEGAGGPGTAGGLGAGAGRAAASEPGASEHAAGATAGAGESGADASHAAAASPSPGAAPERGGGAPATSPADLPQVSDVSLEKVRRLMSDVGKYVGLARTRSAGEVLYRFINDTGYLGRLSREKSAAADEKIRNIAKFFDLLRNFSSVALHDRVPNFVGHLDMLTEAGDDPAVAEADIDVDAVNVLTVHKAKGLEFKVVFMVSLVSQRFPVPHRKEQIELPGPLVKDILPSGDFHLQEERRLFYVGMTRAKEELYLTTARDYGGARPKKVSQFVMEAMDLPKTAPTPFKSSALEVIQRSAGVEPEKLTPVSRPIPPAETLTLSHLQVDDYETCPLKYKYVHILRVPIMRHHAVVYGSAIHRAVQEYLRRKASGIKMTLDEFLRVFECSWVSEGFLTREHEEQRFQAGREALTKFFEAEGKSGVAPTYVEKEFCFFIDNNRVIGRWDRVDEREDGTRIIDFKSSQVHSQKDADKRTKDSLQLHIYALAYQRTFQKTPGSVELHFLGSGLVGRHEVVEADMQDAAERIGDAARGIRARVFEAVPEYMSCQYCAYNGICPSSRWH
jgi:ATP-dependent exoDNAse (exonuclease V) beta subunit